jgi:hypothetical protein
MTKYNKKEMIYVIKLINGIKRNKKHPSTFLIPNKRFLDKYLKVGSIVKIGDVDYRERFWVSIIEFIDKNSMICEIRNSLYSNQPYDFLDKILIKRENIIDVEFFSKEEEVNEEQNEELLNKTENKLKDLDYYEILNKSINTNKN